MAEIGGTSQVKENKAFKYMEFQRLEERCPKHEPGFVDGNVTQGQQSVLRPSFIEHHKHVTEPEESLASTAPQCLLDDLCWMIMAACRPR